MTEDYVSLVGHQDFAGTLRVLDGQIEHCTEEYRAVLQKLAQLHLNRGICSQRMQLNRKALKDYDQALQLIPTHIPALYRKGQVLLALNKSGEAKTAWKAAEAAADPTTPLDILLQVQEALAALDASSSTSAPTTPESVAAARPTTKEDTPAPAAAPAIAPAAPSPAAGAGSAGKSLPNGMPEGGAAEMLAALPLDEPVAAAEPQPVKQAEPAVTQLGAPGAAAAAAAADKPTATPAAATSSTSTSSTATAAAPAASSAAAGGNGKGMRGFLGGKSSSAPSATVGANQAVKAGAGGGAAPAGGSAKATSNGTSSSAPASSSSRSQSPAAAAASQNDDVVELDCTTTTSSSKATRHGWNQAPAALGGGGGPNGMPRGHPAQIARMLQNSHAINLAVMQINSGKYDEAIASLDEVLRHNSEELSARVARGTARALVHNLKGAVEDFDVAIRLEPRYADSYKRRGQARSALGDSDGALSDLAKCIQVLKETEGEDHSRGTRAECHLERGIIYQKKRDYKRSADELQKATELDPTNAMAQNLLGLCRTSMGSIREGVRAYEKAVEIAPNMKEAWLNMGQALKEEGRTVEAEKALSKVISDPKAGAAASKLIGQMRQGQGKHADAIKILDKALASNKEDLRVDLMYLRAICHHALGHASAAAADYNACMNYNPKPNRVQSEESTMYQYLSFYQRELALYVYHNLDRPVLDFSMDCEIPALFKELWCKKGMVTQELVSLYKMQAVIPRDAPAPPPPTPAEVLDPMTQAADIIGQLLQNHHQGFLPNIRQQRAAGYAAIELGQALHALLGERRQGRQLWVNSEGSTGERGCSGRHVFGWRDAMDIVVKWRQLAEPADQVVWVDLLTKREFEQGFGSHTPMFSGQTKCVRYYMNFTRALELQKKVLLEEGHAFDQHSKPIPLGSDEKRESVKKTRTALQMHRLIGQDSWVVVPLSSVSRPGHQLEGTRLTLVKVPNQPDAVEFSIRTPVTPPRWKDYDQELEAAWEGLVGCLLQGDLAGAARGILTFGYYWYNFMPLARGTAAVGYTTILALFWAAGVPVSTPIPKDYQVDWEAILSQHPDAFMERLSKWMVPDQVLAAWDKGKQQQEGAAEARDATATSSSSSSSAAPTTPTGSGSATSNGTSSSSGGGSKGGAGGGSTSSSRAGSPGGSPGTSPRGGQLSGAALVAAAKALPAVTSLGRVNDVLGTMRRRIEALNGPGVPRI